MPAVTFPVRGLAPLRPQFRLDVGRIPEKLLRTTLADARGLRRAGGELTEVFYQFLHHDDRVRLNRPVQLRTVDSWEGLAKSLVNGETDIALLGPWGYVLANHQSGAQVISTILYDGKPHIGTDNLRVAVLGDQIDEALAWLGYAGDQSAQLKHFINTQRNREA